MQIWSVKQDACVHDFKEHAKVQHLSLYTYTENFEYVVSLFLFLFYSLYQIRHQCFYSINFLGDLYHQMESNRPWYEQPKSTVVAGQVNTLHHYIEGKKVGYDPTYCHRSYGG